MGAMSSIPAGPWLNPAGEEDICDWRDCGLPAIGMTWVNWYIDGSQSLILQHCAVHAPAASDTWTKGTNIAEGTGELVQDAW